MPLPGLHFAFAVTPPNRSAQHLVSHKLPGAPAATVTLEVACPLTPGPGQPVPSPAHPYTPALVALSC